MLMSQILHFQAILQIDLTWPLTFICDLWPHEHVKVPILHQFTKFGSNWTSTFQTRWILHFEPILQLNLWWTLTLVYDLWPREHMKGPILYQTKFGSQQTSDFSNEAIFSLSYILTLNDLWPWYMTFDHMNIWRIPYCINKPSSVPIGVQLFKWGHSYIFSISYNLTSDDLWPHQQLQVPMWHLWPNFVLCLESIKACGSYMLYTLYVNLFSQQTTTGDKVIPICLCVFPAKAGDTKKSCEKVCVIWMRAGMSQTRCVNKPEFGYQFWTNHNMDYMAIVISAVCTETSLKVW